MLTSHRRVFNTLHQIAVRLSKILPLSLTDITGLFSSSSSLKRMPFCKPPFRDDDESVNGGYEEESQMRPILERSISKGRWIYWHDLMLEFSSFSAHVIYSVVKHVASNPYTKYRPYPTPAQFAASQDLISRQRHGHRREENTPSPQQAVLVESSSSKAFLSLQLPFVVSIALFLYSCNV